MAAAAPTKQYRLVIIAGKVEANVINGSVLLIDCREWCRVQEVLGQNFLLQNRNVFDRNVKDTGGLNETHKRKLVQAIRVKAYNNSWYWVLPNPSAQEARLYHGNHPDEEFEGIEDDPEEFDRSPDDDGYDSPDAGASWA